MPTSVPIGLASPWRRVRSGLITDGAARIDGRVPEGAWERVVVSVGPELAEGSWRLGETGKGLGWYQVRGEWEKVGMWRPWCRR